MPNIERVSLAICHECDGETYGDHGGQGPNQIAQSLAETRPDRVNVLARSSDNLSGTDAIEKGLVLHDNGGEVLLPQTV